MAVTIGRVVTSGTFSLDGQDFDVDNNIWLIGDDREVVVIDAAHDHRAIADAVGDRRVVAVVCTHGHNDHINAAVPLADEVDAPIWLHPDDRMLWEVVNPGRPVDADLADGQLVEVGGTTLTVLHTPGHSPGGCSLYCPDLGVVFSGDTLFQGGPGATGRSFSDRPTILRSIAEKLLTLPSDTIVHTGHGDDTQIGIEAPGIIEALAEVG
jgi:glyoxylase-like metal-dependent hydrolase (beta-lactamase superfamily II)